MRRHKERDAIFGLGFHFGINGYTLKTEENIKVVAGIPADRWRKIYIPVFQFPVF